MPVLLENNAEGQLASAIDATQITITLKTGHGAMFPAPTSEDWFPVTLHNLQDEVEIVHCTARSGDTLTVIRGAEGTPAKPWLADDFAEIRYTRAVHEALYNRANHVGTQPIASIGPGPSGSAKKVLRQKSDESGVEYTQDPYTYDLVTFKITTLGDLTVAGVLTETSSLRYKENLRDLGGALEGVLKLNGVMYDRIAGSKNNTGFIAEEVDKVMPNVVTRTNGRVEGINYTQLIAYLVESIKTLNDKIERLEEAGR